MQIIKTMPVTRQCQVNKRRVLAHVKRRPIIIRRQQQRKPQKKASYKPARCLSVIVQQQHVNLRQSFVENPNFVPAFHEEQPYVELADAELADAELFINKLLDESNVILPVTPTRVENNPPVTALVQKA